MYTEFFFFFNRISWRPSYISNQFFLIFFFSWLYLKHMEVPRPGIEPMLLQRQCQILNLLCHSGDSSLLFMAAQYFAEQLYFSLFNQFPHQCHLDSFKFCAIANNAPVKDLCKCNLVYSMCLMSFVHQFSKQLPQNPSSLFLLWILSATFFFFLILWLHPPHMGGSQSRDWIQVTASTYTSAAATDPLTRCTGPGIEPHLRRNPSCCSWIPNPLCHSGNSSLPHSESYLGDLSLGHPCPELEAWAL